MIRKTPHITLDMSNNSLSFTRMETKQTFSYGILFGCHKTRTNRHLGNSALNFYETHGINHRTASMWLLRLRRWHT